MMTWKWERPAKAHSSGNLKVPSSQTLLARYGSIFQLKKNFIITLKNLLFVNVIVNNNA